MDRAKDGTSLYLCAGPQSGGTTLLSWCFLQRADMDGYLDASGDQLADLNFESTAPLVWCKTTISCFRLTEMVAHFEDEGWRVRPLLVVRDVRNVFNSLILKSYGVNGLTAEEPPLRLRLKRLKEDWQAAQSRGWPIVRYESLVENPVSTLRKACDDLHLPWDDAMLTWPKRAEQMAEPVHGNPTFRATRGENLVETLTPELARLRTDNIPPDDLTWLESEFEDYNRTLGYPETAPRGESSAQPVQMRAVPSLTSTRRFRRAKRKEALRHWAMMLSGRTLGLMFRPGMTIAKASHSLPAAKRAA